MSLLALSGVLANNHYEPCPAFPPLPKAGDLAADPGVQEALKKVQALLANVSAPLPTGFVATIRWPSAGFTR